MAISEAARIDLYNGLAEMLGPDRAETLMAALPIYEISDLATKTDLALFASSLESKMDRLDTRMDGLESRVDRLDTRMDGLESRMDRLETAIGGLGLRMDRMFLTLTAGLFVIVAAMVGMFLAVT